MEKKTKMKIIIIGTLIVALTVTAVICGTVRKRNGKNGENITVTEKEMEMYREMIGDSMDVNSV